MKYNTFLRIKRVFPANRKESVASYFERLAKFLERDDWWKIQANRAMEDLI